MADRLGPVVRVSGPVGRRTVEVNGARIPSCSQVTVEERHDALQEVTVVFFTDQATVEEPSV